jgi:hypothetical protein
MMYSSSQMKFQAGRLSALRCYNLPFWEHFESLGCTLVTLILHFTELNYLNASLSQMRFQVG